MHEVTNYVRKFSFGASQLKSNEKHHIIKNSTKYDDTLNSCAE